MLGLLFAGAKRDIDKKINSTVSCFLYRKKATVTNAAFEVSANICNSMQEVFTNEKPYRWGKEIRFILIKFLNQFFHQISKSKGKGSPQLIFLCHNS